MKKAEYIEELRKKLEGLCEEEYEDAIRGCDTLFLLLVCTCNIIICGNYQYRSYLIFRYSIAVIGLYELCRYGK